MLRTRLTAAAATTTAVIAAVVTTLAAALPAASAAATKAKDDHRAEVRTVCAPHAYVKERPAAIPIDGLVEGEKVDVRRYSSSGRWAYGSARGPQHHHVKGGWVQVVRLSLRTAQGEKCSMASANAPT